jgi:group I intron endonuclease
MINNQIIGIIYKVTHKESGMTYIGVTKDSLKSRKKDHIQKANKETGHQFQEAIGTYGSEAFSWAQVDTANTISELARKEKEYILQYDCKENGYNQDAGGGFKKTVYQYSVDDGLLVGQYDSLESAANAVSGTRKSISAACLGKINNYNGYHWSFSLTIPFKSLLDKRRKEVLQIDVGGNLVAQFKSVAEASRQTGISKSPIAKTCRGEQKQTGGYYWNYNN